MLALSYLFASPDALSPVSSRRPRSPAESLNDRPDSVWLSVSTPCKVAVVAMQLEPLRAEYALPALRSSQRLWQHVVGIFLREIRVP